MNTKLKIGINLLIIGVVLVGGWFISSQEKCKPQDINKRILIDISHSYSSDITFFVNKLECEGWHVYVLNDPNTNVNEKLFEKKPNVILIYNPWYEPFTEDGQKAIIQFVENGGGLLYIKPRKCYSQPCLDLSNLGYFEESASQIFSVSKESMDIMNRSLDVDTNIVLTNFTDFNLFKNVKNLPYLGSQIKISEPFTAVAWTGENTFFEETADCFCYQSGCDCILNDSTEWGPFSVIAKAEYGDGRIIIVPGSWSYIEDDFKDVNVQNFLMNSLDYLIESS